MDDNTVESLQEEFSVQISSTNPRVIVQDNMADITIIDDDGNQHFQERVMPPLVCYNDNATFFSQLLNLALRLLVTPLPSQGV